MDVVLLVAVVGLWVVLAAFWMQWRRTPASAAAVVPVAPDPGTEIEIRDTAEAVELWWPGGGRLATIRPSAVTAAGRALRSPRARRALTGLLRRAPAAVRPGSRYRVTFPPDLLATVAGGGSVDLVLKGGLGSAVGGPVGALSVGAVAMAAVQQQRLDRTVAVIEQRIDLLLDRARDDDHGRLDAAEALVHQLEHRTTDVPSAQLRAELAAARHSVEAVFFARRRFARRLGEAIGEAQETARAESGEMQAWADGVLDAVGAPDDLRSELLVYLRAVVVRARLATATSEIVAIDGDVAEAGRLLHDTAAELREDIADLRRRLGPLARWAPRRGRPWKRRDWERAHEIVVEVYELMEGDVEPLLPEAEPAPLALEAAIDDEGAVAELTVLDER